ncbi:MAG: hypothetical protein ABI639_05375 [Thermoanaerobaculia bacterium]
MRGLLLIRPSIPLGQRLRRALALALFGTGGLGGEGFPDGLQFQVNTYTTNQQSEPRVASDAQGNFVVVWESTGSAGDDTSSHSIQARRFDVAGTPVGVEFQVNTYTTGNQRLPAVAMSTLGSFVVVWESYGSVGNDSSLRSVQGQRYQANGLPDGAQFQVNTYTTNLQVQPNVAVDAQGNFVVAWTSTGSYGTDSATYSIHAQRYDSAGNQLNLEFQVNAFTTGPQLRPRVAAGAPTDFVVAWTSLGSSGTDSDSYSIQARRVTAGTWGSEFQVNSFTVNGQTYPSVGIDPAGGFVVAWNGYASAGTDTSPTSVQARRFDSSGAPLGPDFQVNTYTPLNQRQVAVAVDGNGVATIAWEGSGSAGTDDDLTSVHARRFASSGAPLGGEFQVNTYTTSYQDGVAIAAAPSGDFVVVWKSRGSVGDDDDNDSIQAQRENGRFRDGFESGDTSRWSSVFP